MSVEEVERKPHSGSGKGRGHGCLSVMVCSIGLAIDFYDFGVVNNVKAMLQEEFGAMTELQETTLGASALVGSVIGQLVIGMLADRVGRRAMFLACSSLTLAGSLLSALAWNPGGKSIYWLLIAFRFLMGIGIGGEYPCCASQVAESTSSGKSGRNLAMCIASMGVGGVLAPTVVLTCLSLGLPHAVTWRVAFGFAAAVSLLSLVLRALTVKNSQDYQEAQRKGQTFRKSFGVLMDKYARMLLGTTGMFFLYDVVSFGLGLYSAQISGVAEGSSIEGETRNTLLFALIALPGAYGAAWYLPAVGRKHTAISGLAAMAVIYVVLAAFFDVLPNWLFTVLYGLQLMWDWMGPSSANYTIPGEIFPTTCRATAHGISSASGKMGAVVGVYVVGVLVDSIGVRWMLLVMCGVNLVNILWVQLLIPYYDENTLEGLEEVAGRGDKREIQRWMYGGGHSRNQR